MSNPEAFLYSKTIDPTALALSPRVLQAYNFMSGIIARDYEAYAPFQTPHLLNSHLAITEAADLAAQRIASNAPSKAIILGAGACLDIPIEHIADTFDTVTVVEVDAATTEPVLASLPKNMQRKINLVQADISGVAPEMFAIADQASRPSFNNFVGSATEIVQGIDPSTAAPNFGQDYDFVCSQLLTTQLTASPFEHLRRTVQRRYGRSYAQQLGSPENELAFAMNTVNLASQEAHARSLGKMVSKTGVVHFADTLFKHEGGQKLPMTTASFMETLYGDLSDISEPEAWEWYASSNKVYTVYSTALARTQ